MIFYCSRTGTKRNLAVMRASGWHLLVSRAGVWRTEGFPYAIENGAWSDHQQGKQFDEDAFERLIEKLGDRADFIVLPDIVAGGMRSLDLSMRWQNRCRAICDLVLIPVQDGMTPGDLAPLVSQHVGIFLGGSTEWKIDTAPIWGAFCAERRVYLHFARVNTAKRMFLAIAAGANSGDGSSGARYACTVPMLDAARRHRDLFALREVA